MGKEYDFLKAVREQDIHTLGKILSKSKSKLTGSIKKFNINFQDRDGMAAIHHAALLGNVEIMKLLIENGANVRLKDCKGMHPIHYASWRGFSQLAYILLNNGAAASEGADQDITPLHLACEHGHCDVVTLLLEHHADPMRGNYQHKTPLHLAAEFGRYRVVELLIHSNKCSPLLGPMNAVHDPPSTCLHLAARNGHEHVVRLLLQSGMDVNQETIKGTCLHEAALAGKIEVVNLLIAFGVDVNRANASDQTALDIVEKFTTMKGSQELKMLLKSASDRDSGISPQHQQHKAIRPLSAYQALHATHGDAGGRGLGSVPTEDRTAEWVGNLMSEQHSPGSSNRNSMASSTGSSDSAHHPPPLQPQQQQQHHHMQQQQQQQQQQQHYNQPVYGHHRLSGTSYESGASLQSFNSNSSSSMGSLDRLDSPNKYQRPFNADDLLVKGYKDTEVLRMWLEQLQMDEYVHLFRVAEYDMPTIARMTPDDLIAIGIQKPAHRKRLKFEINRMVIRNCIPDHVPATVEEWLQLLGLHQYYSHLWHQGYQTTESLKGITWEDLEEIGIRKLGHQKKIMLAVTQLKRAQSASVPPSPAIAQQPAHDAPPTNSSPSWLGAPPPVATGPPPYTRGSNLATYPSASDMSGSGSYEDDEASQQSAIRGSSEILNLRAMVSSHKKDPVKPDVVAIQVARTNMQASESENAPEDSSKPLTYESFREPKKDAGDSLPSHYETAERGGPAMLIPVEMLKQRRESSDSSEHKPFMSFNSGTLPRHRPRLNQHKGDFAAMGVGDLEIPNKCSSAPVSPADKVGGKRPPPPPKRTNSIKGGSSPLPPPPPPSIPPKPSTPQLSNMQNHEVEESEESMLTADEMDYPPPPPPLTSTEKKEFLATSLSSANGSPHRYLPAVSSSSSNHTGLPRSPAPILQKPQLSVLPSKPHGYHHPQPPPQQPPPPPAAPMLPPKPAASYLNTSVSSNHTSITATPTTTSSTSSSSSSAPKSPVSVPPKPRVAVLPTPQSPSLPKQPPATSTKPYVQHVLPSQNPPAPPKPPIRDIKNISDLKPTSSTVTTTSTTTSSSSSSVVAEKNHLNDVIQQMEQALKNPPPPAAAPTPPTAPADRPQQPERPPPPPPTAGSQQQPPSSDESDSDTEVASQCSSTDTPSATGSIDFSTLPFANENVGTIKQRTAASKPSIMDVSIGGEDNEEEDEEEEDEDEDYVDFVETGTMKRNPNAGKAVVDTSSSKFPMPAPVKLPESLDETKDMEFSGEDSSAVLNDIDSMLQGLTDELDAMLELEIA